MSRLANNCTSAGAILTLAGVTIMLVMLCGGCCVRHPDQLNELNSASAECGLPPPLRARLARLSVHPTLSAPVGPTGRRNGATFLSARCAP